MGELEKKTFLEAYDAHADSLYRHAYFRVHDRGKAEELMQEAFMRAWEYSGSHGLPQNLRAFLYRVLNNLIIDDFRKKKPASLDELSEAGFEPAEESADVDIVEVAIIREMLGELPDHHREVVVMRFIDGFTPSEIAEVTGERENTVSVRIHRALLKLKKAYEARQKKAA
jgi:RNA polymerase sigma-70 factor (ECF subfamily)